MKEPRPSSETLFFLSCLGFGTCIVMAGLGPKRAEVLFMGTAAFWCFAAVCHYVLDKMDKKKKRTPWRRE